MCVRVHVATVVECRVTINVLGPVSCSGTVGVGGGAVVGGSIVLLSFRHTSADLVHRAMPAYEQLEYYHTTFYVQCMYATGTYVQCVCMQLTMHSQLETDIETYNSSRDTT